MTEKHIAQQHHATFESLRHIDENGNEYWQDRQLEEVLEYSQYRHFLPVVERAKEACTNSGQSVADHFEDILTMVEIGSGAKRQIEDLHLSRYTCYLIVQYGDPSKPVIANGQTCFAIQTRRRELAADAIFEQPLEVQSHAQPQPSYRQSQGTSPAVAPVPARSLRPHTG